MHLISGSQAKWFNTVIAFLTLVRPSVTSQIPNIDIACNINTRIKTLVFRELWLHIHKNRGLETHPFNTKRDYQLEEISLSLRIMCSVIIFFCHFDSFLIHKYKVIVIKLYEYLMRKVPFSLWLVVGLLLNNWSVLSNRPYRALD